jgi:hypothetical protein
MEEIARHGDVNLDDAGKGLLGLAAELHSICDAALAAAPTPREPLSERAEPFVERCHKLYTEVASDVLPLTRSEILAGIANLVDEAPPGILGRPQETP